MSSFFRRSDSKHVSQFSLKGIVNRKSLGIKAFCLFKIIWLLLKIQHLKGYTLIDWLTYPPPVLQIGLVGCLHW